MCVWLYVLVEDMRHSCVWDDSLCVGSLIHMHDVVIFVARRLHTCDIKSRHTHVQVVSRMNAISHVCMSNVAHEI